MGNSDITPEMCEIGNFTDVTKEVGELYVEVMSDACPPCKILKAEIDAHEKEIPYPVVEVPADVCPALALELGVVVYPTVLHMKKGKEISRFEGMSDEVVPAMKEGK